MKMLLSFFMLLATGSRIAQLPFLPEHATYGMLPCFLSDLVSFPLLRPCACLQADEALRCSPSGSICTRTSA